MHGLSQDVQTHGIARLCQNFTYLSKSLQARKDLFIGHLHCDILQSPYTMLYLQQNNTEHCLVSLHKADKERAEERASRSTHKHDDGQQCMQ